MSIEAVLQPRFYYAMSYFSFDAEVLFAFFAFGDTFFTLGLMVHIGLGSDRRRLAGFTSRLVRFRQRFEKMRESSISPTFYEVSFLIFSFIFRTSDFLKNLLKISPKSEKNQ